MEEEGNAGEEETKILSYETLGVICYSVMNNQYRSLY
jgi:hypothetical protein